MSLYPNIAVYIVISCVSCWHGFTLHVKITHEISCDFLFCARHADLMDSVFWGKGVSQQRLSLVFYLLEEQPRRKRRGCFVTVLSVMTWVLSTRRTPEWALSSCFNMSFMLTVHQWLLSCDFNFISYKCSCCISIHFIFKLGKVSLFLPFLLQCNYILPVLFCCSHL